MTVSSSTSKGCFAFISHTFCGLSPALSDIQSWAQGIPWDWDQNPSVPQDRGARPCALTELLAWSFFPIYFVCKAAGSALSNTSSTLRELKKLVLNPGFPVSPWWGSTWPAWAWSASLGTAQELCKSCSRNSAMTAGGTCQGFNNSQLQGQNTAWAGGRAGLTLR